MSAHRLGGSQAGLLPAERTTGGYRVYDEAAIERLGFISSAKHLGLPLEEIAELLGVWASGACRDVKADLRPRVMARIADAQERAAELAAFTAVLHRALEHLDALPDRLERCDPQCAFLAQDVQEPSAAKAEPAPEPVTEVEPERWRTAPVACSLSGSDVRERAGQWRDLLAGARRDVIADGVRLRVPVERTGAVAALAAGEQQCCAFFDFRMHLDGPVLTLEVRAPQAAQDLLAELFISTS